MAERFASEVKALSDIARALSLEGPDDKCPASCLETLAATMSAQKVVLAKKLFVNEADAFILETISQWPDERKTERVHPDAWPSLRVEDLRPEWWERLECGEPVYSEETFKTDPGSLRKIYVVPLFLAGHLSCLLFCSNLEYPERLALLEDFISAVRYIFEMWITKVDLRQRVTDVIDFWPNPSHIIDEHGVVRAWNPAMERLTGWKAERVLGKGNCEPALAIYGFRRPMVSELSLWPNPEWEARFFKFDRRGNDIFAEGCSALVLGGIHTKIKVSRIFDINNRLRGAIGMSQDITREQLLEDDLKLTKEMYRDLGEFAGIGIVFSQEDKIIYRNEIFEEMVGESTGKDVSLKDLFARIHPDDLEQVSNHFEAFFKGLRTSAKIEFRTGHGDDRRYYRGYIRAIDYDDNPSVYFFMENISDQIESARMAERKQISMIHGDRLTTLGTMAAGIAHELNQPLNTIRIIAEGILYGQNKGWVIGMNELVDDLNMISRQVSRMSSIVNNIRDFARQEYGATLVDVDVNKAVENVFSMLGRQLEAHNIRVRKELTWGIGHLRAQQTGLEQVIINLLVNAREALEECEHDGKEIWLRTGRLNGQIVIELGDNATGIPESLGDRIFEPYLTTKDAGKGTGLGLSISRSIVAEMGGHIEYFNNEQGGATFLATFPKRGDWR